MGDDFAVGRFSNVHTSDEQKPVMVVSSVDEKGQDERYVSAVESVELAIGSGQKRPKMTAYCMYSNL